MNVLSGSIEIRFNGRKRLISRNTEASRKNWHMIVIFDVGMAFVK
jgi:hypothetical protein